MAAPPIRQRNRTPDARQSTTKRCTENGSSLDFYSVTLDRTVHGKELGVNVDFAQAKLRIRAINDGMVKRFNEMNDGQCVRPGDEILKVNDVTGDAQKMALACKTESKLRLLLCKGVDLKNSVPQAKRPKVEATSSAQVAGQTSRGLYDFLPASNPVNDALAKKEAKINNSSARCTSYAINRCVFLDIDGVLRPLQGSTFNVSTITIDGISIPLAGCGSDFLASAMTALRFIIQETGAQLVLSSEWRRHPTLKEGVQEALRLAHLPPLVADTTTDVQREMGTGDPLFSFAERRVKEMGAYLRANPCIDSWVAIDDIDLSVADSRKSLSKPQIGDNFVRTEDDVGLTIDLARNAIEILNRKPAKR